MISTSKYEVAIDQVRDTLLALADVRYRAFATRLIPQCSNLIGVRIPLVRQLAKRVAKEVPLAAVMSQEELYFEETLLKGFMVGQLKGELSTVLPWIVAFVPKITNWSLCDSFCSGLKITRRYPQAMWDFLVPYWEASSPYAVRFAIVMGLLYFTDEAHLEALFQHFERLPCDHLYVKLAIAWAIATCFSKFPERTFRYLQTSTLETWTYHKALQKIGESLRVDTATKALVKTLRRPV